MFEQVQERLPEVAIHEAIRDGIGARRGESQQLERHQPPIAEVDVDQLGRKQCDRVDRMNRRPANEKLENHHEQHFDDTTLLQPPLRLL